MLACGCRLNLERVEAALSLDDQATKFRLLCHTGEEYILERFHVESASFRCFVRFLLSVTDLLGELLLSDLYLSCQVLRPIVVLLDLRADEVSQLVDFVVHARVEKGELLVELGLGFGERGVDSLVDGGLRDSQTHRRAGSERSGR